jgi:hypothetical protein
MSRPSATSRDGTRLAALAGGTRLRGFRCFRNPPQRTEKALIASASFNIIARDGLWSIEQAGDVPGSYATTESAFEAVAAAASNAIKEGLEISIHVPGSDGSEPSLGAS